MGECGAPLADLRPHTATADPNPARSVRGSVACAAPARSRPAMRVTARPAARTAPRLACAPAAAPAPARTPSRRRADHPRALPDAATATATLAALADAAPQALFKVPGIVGDTPFTEGAVSGFLLILFSELGDKTFFIALLLALRRDRGAVFAGTFGALAVMTCISVGGGVVEGGGGVERRRARPRPPTPTHNTPSTSRPRSASAAPCTRWTASSPRWAACPWTTCSRASS